MPCDVSDRRRLRSRPAFHGKRDLPVKIGPARGAELAIHVALHQGVGKAIAIGSAGNLDQHAAMDRAGRRMGSIRDPCDR